jgi:hypothetical protein
MGFGVSEIRLNCARPGIRMSTNDAPKTERRIQLEKAQAKRDAYDKRSRDVAEARQKELEIDATKTASLRRQRLAKNAADEAAAPPPAKPAPPRSARTQ